MSTPIFADDIAFKDLNAKMEYIQSYRNFAEEASIFLAQTLQQIDQHIQQYPNDPKLPDMTKYIIQINTYIGYSCQVVTYLDSVIAMYTAYIKENEQNALNKMLLYSDIAIQLIADWTSNNPFTMSNPND
jgi:hypothetical protein